MGFAVNEVVVGAAEREEVVDVGGAVVSPPADVVGVAPGGGSGAAWEPAAAIADEDSAAEMERHGWFAAPVVQDSVPGA